jgi:hypothetical protein
MDRPAAARQTGMFEVNEKALNEARDFHDWMLRQHEDRDTVWFVNVLTALLRGLIIEYEQLNLGYQQSARLMAWACRNLMEISIYTEYALNSEENAHELIEDMLMDTLDVFTSFKRWFAALEPAMPTPELDAALKLFQETKTDVGISRRTFRTTRELARLLDREPDYLHANKVSSKLIHPTAWSLLSLDLDKEDALMRPYIYQAGSKYFAESFLRIRQYVGKYGTKPIPKMG